MDRLEEEYYVNDWTIKNFNCWNNEIHGNAITSPELISVTKFTFKLYPRGLGADGEHLVVCLCNSEPTHFTGELSIVGSDGSLLCTQQVDSKKALKVLELPLQGPKFEEVVAQIREKEAIHGDRLTLRYQLRSWNGKRHMSTTIHALDVSFKIQPEVFNKISSIRSPISFMKFPGHETEINTIGLDASKDAHSNTVLALYQFGFKKNFSVLTRMSVLSNGDVVRTEENEHLFRDEDDEWNFCDSLKMEEVKKRGSSVILHFKIVPSCNYKYSLGFIFNLLHPFTFGSVTASGIKPLGTNFSKEPLSNSLSTVTVPNPESSLTVLSSELMCLFQDRDFSDFRLKCGDVSFPVHRNILSARSPVFKTMLSTDMQEAMSGCMDIVDLDPSTLALFLTYLYTGAVEDLQGESALKLYYAADKYLVPSLKRECTNFLCENVSNSNVCDVLSLANRHQDDQLIKVANDFLLENYNEVLESEEWKIFMKSEPLLAAETVTLFGEKEYVGKKGAL